MADDDWCVVGDDTSSMSSSTSATLVPSVPSSSWDMIGDRHTDFETPAASEADTPRDINLRKEAARRMAECMGGPWAVIESNHTPEVVQRHRIRNTRIEKCKGGKHWNSPPGNLVAGAQKYTHTLKMC